MCAVTNSNKLRIFDSTQRETRRGAHQPEQAEAAEPSALVQEAGGVPNIAHERRLSPRLPLHLPLRLRRVAGKIEPMREALFTSDINSTGVYFLAPRQVEPGTTIELQIGLVDEPPGGGSLWMRTAAHVVRVEPTEMPGWHALAAVFDTIAFECGDAIPRRRESS